jgi:hypothetical protein
VTIDTCLRSPRRRLLDAVLEPAAAREIARVELRVSYSVTIFACTMGPRCGWAHGIVATRWTALEGRPGPVHFMHFNIPLREPLVLDMPLTARMPLVPSVSWICAHAFALRAAGRQPG